MFTKAFWVDAGERTVRTVAQTLLALLTGSATDLIHTQWTTDLSLAGMAGVLSLLTSLIATGVGVSGTASLIAKKAPVK